jgi:hypothetical protein
MDIETVLKNIRVDAAGCWLWKGKLNRDGYARSGNREVHRFTYEVYRCGIPEGLEIDHLCHVRHCVNPDHLEPVTHAENVQRGILVRPAISHCKNGHPYDEENTYWRPSSRKGGRRQCRTCNRAAVAALKARKGGAA